MQKYPDEIIILEPTGDINNPYDGGNYVVRYRGRCRCYLKKPTALRMNEVKNSTHRVVIPDRKMLEVGENWRVAIDMHTNPSSKKWDLVGYVTDFARYDRVCNLDFEMVKEELIMEDIPASTLEPNQRTLMTIYDGDFMLEGVNVLRGNIVVGNSNELTLIAWKRSIGANIFKELCILDPDGKYFVKDYMRVTEMSIGDQDTGYHGIVTQMSYTYGSDDEEEKKRLNTYYLLLFDQRPEKKGAIIITEPYKVFEFTVVEDK